MLYNRIKKILKSVDVFKPATPTLIALDTTLDFTTNMDLRSGEGKIVVSFVTSGGYAAPDVVVDVQNMNATPACRARPQNSGYVDISIQDAANGVIRMNAVTTAISVAKIEYLRK
jgi:hypothetical protein